MTTHRRYWFDNPGEWAPGDYAKVLGTLQHACEVYWWFNEPEVMGQQFDRLTFSFTVSARDQWWAHRRAMGLAGDCYHALGKWEKDIPVPMWEPLEPHSNRGRWRVPTASD